MLSQLQTLFSNPEIQAAMEKRVLESLMPTKTSPWAAALRAGGTALATTPGNFLQGLAAATGPAAEAHAAAKAPDKNASIAAMKMLDDMVNLGKAQSTEDNRVAEHKRRMERDEQRGKYEQGRLGALLEGLGIKRLLADSLVDRRENQNVNDAARTGAYVDNVGSQIDRRGFQTENDTARTGIMQQNADTNASRAATAARQGDERNAIARQRAENEQARIKKMEAEGIGGDRVYNEANRILQNMQKEMVPEAGTSTEADYKAGLEAYQTERKKFIQGLSPELRKRFEGESQAPAAGGTPAKINSKAEFDALPSGTRFIAPDGKVRIKP